MELKGNIVVLIRVQDLKTPTLGSTKDRCSQCDCEVWVGPDILLHPEARDAKKLCIPCAVTFLVKPNTKIERFEIV